MTPGNTTTVVVQNFEMPERSDGCSGKTKKKKTLQGKITKGRRKRENIVTAAKLLPGRKKCFWKISKTLFAFNTQVLCLQEKLRGSI